MLSSMTMDIFGDTILLRNMMSENPQRLPGLFYAEGRFKGVFFTPSTKSLQDPTILKRIENMKHISEAMKVLTDQVTGNGIDYKVITNRYLTRNIPTDEMIDVMRYLQLDGSFEFKYYDHTTASKHIAGYIKNDLNTASRIPSLQLRSRDYPGDADIEYIFFLIPP